MKRIVLIAIAFACTLSTAAQGNNSPEIKVLARALQDKIMIRWAPDTPLSWKQLNQHGYILERYTVSRDGKTLPQPELKLLTPNTLVPAPLESWTDLIESNDYAAVIAQALYGEEFQVTGGSKIEALVALSEDLQQRYTFALFSADQDFEIAQKAALGYVDTDIKANEKYLYRVISNVPKEQNAINYGGVYIGVVDFEPLPEPLDFAGLFNDGNTMLSWNFKLLSDTYNSYYIERADANGSFRRISDEPYSILNQGNQDERTGRIFYVDSITNNKKYQYRIQGITTFGERGPYSEIVSGEGKKILKYVPHLTVKNIVDDNTVKLTWEFPEEGNNQIKGFELNRSNGEGTTEEVLIRNIPPTSRTVTHKGLRSSNYFTITAVGKQNNKRTSFPMLVQPPDSIPPAIPVGLKGEIDSLGNVTLSWQPNKDRDLLGYRIFRGSKAEEELSQVTSSPIAGNSFQDKVSLKNMIENVYYQVVAVDQRYNASEASEKLLVKKPDNVPPTSPVIKSYAFSDDKINLTWTPSSSEDVERQVLYRKKNNEANWQLVYDGNKEADRYADEDLEEGNLYSYTVLAVDDNGLESPPAPSISIMVPKKSNQEDIRSFNARADKQNGAVSLAWRCKEEGIAEFELYKGKEGEQMRLLRVVPEDTRRLTDFDMTINTQYEYGIKAIYKDGRSSKIKKVKVKY